MTKTSLAVAILVAVRDMLQALYMRGRSFCVCRKGQRRSRGYASSSSYIEARPERMHEPFRKLALEALGEAWPCKR
jgi:Rap1a immunity proteins